MNKPGSQREKVYLTHGKDSWRGIRTQRYTYAWFGQSGKPHVLYDNEKDPYQMNDLLSDPASKELTKKMHAMLVQLLEEVSDPLAEKAAAAKI
jgi:hypothetical protein